MKILVINGPSINMLGIREPHIYGTTTYAELEKLIADKAKDCGAIVECFQSNHEGAIIDRIHSAYKVFDGIIINAAAYSHTSIAIADALRAIGARVVGVHISDTSKREDYRKVDYIADVAEKYFIGLGTDGYIRAIEYLLSTPPKG